MRWQIMKYLQDELEDYLKSNKILKKDFAKKIGISPAMLSHWLKGRVAFKNTLLEKIIAEIQR